MANSKHKLDREEIMSFLLGELEEAETSRIESMFLSDPTYSEAVEEAKSQLLEEYKTGRLSPARSGRFEKRLLPNIDEDKQKFEAMLERNEQERSAQETVSTSSSDSSSSDSSSSDSSSSDSSSSDSSSSDSVVDSDAKASSKKNAASAAPATNSRNASGRMSTILIVVALAIVGAGAAFLLRGKSEKVVENVALSIFSVRGQSQVIVLPPGDTVRLQMPLPPHVASQHFAITLFHGDTQSSLSAERVGDTVQTTIHRSEIVEGRYDLELRSSGEGDQAGVIGYYSFRR